jgi:hypothetical protein
MRSISRRSFLLGAVKVERLGVEAGLGTLLTAASVHAGRPVDCNPACEIAVAGMAASLVLQGASGRPSAIVGWNNNYGDAPTKA